MIVTSLIVYYAFSTASNIHSLFDERLRSKFTENGEINNDTNNLGEGLNFASSLPLNSIYRLSSLDINGHLKSLSDFTGCVSLVVNVASHWGKANITYEQLPLLHERYKNQGFAVLAFPSNDFEQEFETNEEIQKYIKTNYPKVNFTIFAKSSLRTNPVYKKLSEHHIVNNTIEWNFYKYLVNQKGIAVALYDVKQEPFSFEEDIQNLLE